MRAAGMPEPESGTGARPRVRIMVVGTPRSGTTLVQRFVTEECGLRGGPETHFFTTLPLILRRSTILLVGIRIGIRERELSFSLIPR